MTTVLAVAFGPKRGAPASAGHQALDTLMRDNWRPVGADWRALIVPYRWWGVVESIEAEARSADAILLFGGRGPKRRARVARFARNETRPDAVDALGLSWPGVELAPRAPAVLSATLHPERLAHALNLSGLPAKATTLGDRAVCNHALYRLLARRAAPLIGLVRLPLSLESARCAGRLGYVNRMQNITGAAAAVSFAAAAVEAEPSGLAAIACA